MTVAVLQAARRDLTDGYWFYEYQEVGLGNYFLTAIYSDLARLTKTAGVHRRVPGTGHRVKSRQFPYLIYYRVNGNVAEVLAIIDGRRSPKWIREHLGLP